MVMSTQILVEASQLMNSHILIDSIQLYTVGSPVTVGAEVTRALTPVGSPVEALVQTTRLAGAAESQVENVYSVKVSQGTDISAGQVFRVLECPQEPSLVDKTLLIDKVSQNGAAVLRKGISSDFHVVNQEGKGSLT